MKNYRVRFVLCFFAVIVFITAFFISPETVIGGVSNGLKLCAVSIIPSLFPFIVLSDYLIRSRSVEIFGRFLEPVTKAVFRLPGSAGCAVIMSLVGGYPVGAGMIVKLLENGSISQNQAKRMMLFCVNAGPAFVIGTVGTVMFSNRKAGTILYLSMIVSALVMGAFFRFFDSSALEIRTKMPEFKSGVLNQSVTNSINSMFNLCAWVVLFSCVNALLESFSIPDSVMMWIKMITEVTGGCIAASGKYPVSVQALIMGWAGLSVHCQLLPYIKETQVKYLHFILSRLFHGALSATIAKFLFWLFPCQTSVFSTNTEVLPQLYSVSVPAAVATVILAVMLAAEITTVFRNKNNGEA